MRVSIACLLLALAALPALAAEEGALRPGGTVEPAAGARPVTKSTFASTVEPAMEAPGGAPLGNLKPGGSCGASDFEVCLDSKGRIHVPGAKRFLPQVPGLTPERLTVKRSGVVFSYSF